MSAPKRPSDDQDPDYVSPGPTNAKQQKFYEETARVNTANKIVGIVEKEFTKEIDAKEKEVLEIQNRLHKALKTLHLLRYVVITDFYNRKQCQASQSAVDTKQTQIHPAIKRLIGKTPRRQKGLGLEDPGPSTSANFQSVLEEDENKEAKVKVEVSEIEKRLGQFSGTNNNQDLETGKVSEQKIVADDIPKKIPRYIPPKSNLPTAISPSRGVRHKVRKRIVVGNISKWIPPDWREDGASHKWMMYVRGSKDAPDITDFVSKVRFFLHPSYQPNDVVQVVSSPFHLSRRGWGEFPLRVQLHFKNVLNKPMDIIHYLKLDRTYTGLQTLGSETVVDIWIHTTTPHNFKKNLDSEIGVEDLTSKSNDKIQSKDNQIDLSIIKKECLSQGSETLVNSLNILNNTVEVEPVERRASAESNYQLINENCIKIEHNYVSNVFKDQETTEVVHSMENNVTIKHSPSIYSQELENKEQNLGESEMRKDSLSPNDNKNEDRDKSDEIVAPRTNSNGLCESGSNISQPVSELETNLGTGVAKNVGKNSQNGEVASPMPIKLVKCNDKFFFMADIGKLPNNQVEFVKIANSNIVKNILAKRIQPTKVSVLGNADGGLKRIIFGNQEMVELSNGENGPGKEKSEYSGARLEAGIDSMERISKDFSFAEREMNSKLEYPGNKLLKNNSQQLEMQRLASSLKSIPSKSQPLKITIPPPFEPTRKKQILVLKNNKLISVNAANNSSSLAAALNSRQLAPRSILYEKNQESLININKVSLSMTAAPKPTEGGISLLKPSISILKKPIVKLEPSKAPTILKINPSNSLLLNSNSAIPALQIATPFQGAQNERRNMIVENRIAQMKLKRLPKCVKIDNTEESKPFKVSVTLGKDKQKILSKRDVYEEVLRSIETIQLNDTVGTLRYIMKRIPLITEDARDSDYKQMHPYACCTQEEFFNYHLGKQRAHEWYRAKMVRSLLKKKGFVNDQLWSIREILNWARIHGYTPLQSSLAIGNGSSKTSKKLPDANSTTISTCTESLQFNEWLDNCKDSNNLNYESDVEVDVVHISEAKIKTEIKTEVIELPEDTITLEVEPSLQLPCAFVNETAREIGVRLQKEDIIPGVVSSAAERVIAQAMQCLVDDLVRRSLAKAWERNSNKCPDTIILDDVRGALLSREEFDVFTNEGLGSLQNIG